MRENEPLTSTQTCMSSEAEARENGEDFAEPLTLPSQLGGLALSTGEPAVSTLYSNDSNRVAGNRLRARHPSRRRGVVSANSLSHPSAEPAGVIRS